MSQTTEQLGISFLADLALGGFAESMSPRQRRAIHIPTELDDYLDSALEQGRQVVLTGNPGDGKTQHIYIEQERYPSEDGYYYILDASEYGDYTELLGEWHAAYEAGKPGILAINDGPLYEMTTSHADEYPFLNSVQAQLESQVVYDDDDLPAVEFGDLIVIDLNNRNVLVPDIIESAIRQFTDFALDDDHVHAGKCQLQYNAQKIQNSETARENLVELLLTVGRREEHVTVRDLINFVCYIITGGYSECITEYGELEKYYNLAFTGDGEIFDLFRDQFDLDSLTHPFVDMDLWAAAEQKVQPGDREDRRAEIRDVFRQHKRRFLFEGTETSARYESGDLYRNIDHEFLKHRNAGRSRDRFKQQFIERINRYFVANDIRSSELRLWLSHRFRSKSSLALVSRTTVPDHDLQLRWPRLHPEIREAISYTPSKTVLEYRESDRPVRLEVTERLYKTLSALDANVPYILRDRDEEQQLLEFMEDTEYYETYSETRGDLLVKDTETGDIVEVEVENGRYRI